MNLKLTIEYDGTDFYGWQVQSEFRTVQGDLMKAIKRLMPDVEFRLIGASRTDRGVHAEGQVANLLIENLRFKTLEEFHKALNHVLPPDIYVRKIERVDDSFHARFSAKSKVYRYRILPERRSPLRRRFVWEYPYSFDRGLLFALARHFVGEHDFKFLAVAGEERTTVCRILRAEWKIVDDEVHFEIEGNRFLYKMVRALVGLMMRIASGREPSDAIRLALLGKQKPKLWFAPPHGLTLVEVRY